MDYQGRVRCLQAKFAEAEVDALLVTDLTNVRYLTGFSGTNAQVLVTAGGATFFSDPRYAARAADVVEGAEVAIYPNRLIELLPERLKGARVERLGIEAKTMPVAERDDLSDKLEETTLVRTSGLVEDLRRMKDDGEIELIKQAVAVADEALAWIIERLAPGQLERDVALEVEVKMRQMGAEAVSFEPIVGSGPLSAHIHHSPTERSLEKGDLVLLDFGCRWEGYCSDLTRTVVLGPATEQQRDLYALVLAAQTAGIEATRAGADGRDVDASARTLIADAGYGERFGHGLGHGVGLDIHEAPRLHRTSEDTLVAGNVVTAEPGIYVSDLGGIRIEDCVVVTESGAEVLGSAPKDELIEL